MNTFILYDVLLSMIFFKGIKFERQCFIFRYNNQRVKQFVR